MWCRWKLINLFLRLCILCSAHFFSFHHCRKLDIWNFLFIVASPVMLYITNDIGSFTPYFFALLLYSNITNKMLAWLFPALSNKPLFKVTLGWIHCICTEIYDKEVPLPTGIDSLPIAQFSSILPKIVLYTQFQVFVISLPNILHSFLS